MDGNSETQPSIRARVANACDVCKARKVKCDGNSPCARCLRHQRPQSCHYSPQRRRPPRAARAGEPEEARKSPRTSVRRYGSRPSSHHPTPAASHGVATPAATGRQGAADGHGDDGSPGQGVLDGNASTGTEEHDETEVPREARLLCDAQGKLIFIGDCAPLSFFQTVRQLVTSRVDPHAFAPETSRYSMLENANPRTSAPSGFGAVPPAVNSEAIGPAVSAYLSVTSGLVDLFDHARLVEDLALWAGQSIVRQDRSADMASSAVNYLVLAIGCQKTDAEVLSQAYFNFARDHAFANLSGNLSVETVQAFLLVTLYMLGACQINGAFLFFGIAVRAAYSVGIHRTEVNSRFGPEIHRQRDRLWKSLRVVDLFLSTSMGRPPATSDVDCTVSYRATGEDGQEAFDLLNASAQIFLIIEEIVLEVYSRRKISPQLTEGISRELRDWSARWLPQLKDTLARQSPAPEEAGLLNGVCQALSSYYYAVILVSRPFLMYELRRKLSESSPSIAPERTGLVSGKSKLADACIDAASLMVDPVHDLIGRGMMARRAPVVVSWIFASSLVLGLGLLGGFGRIIEKYCRLSITALEYFAESDAHAMQYSLIAKSLLATALKYLEKKEAQERIQRTESSSQLFGLLPRSRPGDGEKQQAQARPGTQQATSPSGGSVDKEAVHGRADSTRSAHLGGPLPRYGFDIGSPFFGFSDTLPRTPDFSVLTGSLETDGDQSFGALNLFPLLDTSGHIDLAHYF